MNIKEAKDEIKNTLRAYLKKDENGKYTFPLLRQRPILLMGPPGIGKTAIMEQIARECEIGLVAYTITHHTRQSAIGLPQIKTRTFGGQELNVTEYTMSEIIASVYDSMERTGKKEGILFIDEINCASETLAPIMLQFLQNKTFGSHKVPEGWMIVAAGNPPEYNKSVREFDIVTLDRVRQIDITADVDVWLNYAVEHQVHGAIISYLGLKPDHFYLVENTPQEKHFVTARGWEDLSEILKSYEEVDVPVNESLIIQYLQKQEVARDFCVYYLLYCKYGSDYGIKEILAGELSEEEYEAKKIMSAKGGFEERFTVVHLILDYLNVKLAEYKELDIRTTMLYEELLRLKKEMLKPDDLQDFIKVKQSSLKALKNVGMFKFMEEARGLWCTKMLESYLLYVKQEHCQNAEEILEVLREQFHKEVEMRKTSVNHLKLCIKRAFSFLEDCFKDSQEMVLFVTGLAKNENAMNFFIQHGCDEFLEKSTVFCYREQEQSLIAECEELL